MVFNLINLTPQSQLQIVLKIKVSSSGEGRDARFVKGLNCYDPTRTSPNRFTLAPNGPPNRNPHLKTWVIFTVRLCLRFVYDISNSYLDIPCGFCETKFLRKSF